MRDPLDLAATPERLRAALDAAGTSEATLGRGLSLADATPSRREWGTFLSAALLLLGMALVLAGAISFFAFNWESLGRYGKFALLEGAIALAAVIGWKYRDGLVGRTALFAASVLVGPLLGVFGQTYQTGADPWGLFAAWAVLILPWVVAACFTPLWLLALALIDVALALYWQQALDPGRNAWMSLFTVIAAVHAVAIVAFEAQHRLTLPWLTDSWGPRLVVASGFSLLLVPSVLLIVAANESGPWAAAGLAFLVAAMAATFFYYRSVRRDLFMLTAVAGSAFVLVTTAIGRVIIVNAFGIGAFFLMAMIIVAEIGFVVAWLRRLHRDWSAA
jgi:uncharacterized membrane protein